MNMNPEADMPANDNQDEINGKATETSAFGSLIFLSIIILLFWGFLALIYDQFIVDKPAELSDIKELIAKVKATKNTALMADLAKEIQDNPGPTISELDRMNFNLDQWNEDREAAIKRIIDLKNIELELQELRSFKNLNQ